MSQSGKDSPEVVKFMALFGRLKDWSDNSPEELADLAANDDSVKELCSNLSFAAHFLEANERRKRTLFAAPVNPAFLSAWRDYEERYASVVSDVFWSEFFPEFTESKPAGISKADLQWESADEDAQEQAAGIAEVIYFGQFNVDQNERWSDQPEIAEQIREGIAAWERLEQNSGFNLRGVFRRRALIPFVLVPRQVAAKHGSTDKLSMLKNLQQAHDAFVFGSTYAALALMRSIMEALLRDHYHADGKDLHDRIRSASKRLPLGANEAALHRLRKLANAILHLDLQKDEGLLNMDDVRLEKEIVSLLFVLRALIEGAK